MAAGPPAATNGTDRQAVRERGLRLLLGALAAILLTFGGLGGVFLWYDHTARSVLHTREVRQEIGDILQALTDAETAQRGYLLTGDAAFLAQIDAARRRAEAEAASVAALTRDNPDQQARMRALRAAMDARLGMIEQTVARRGAGDLAGAVGLIRTGRGVAAMNQIRAQVAALDAAEAHLEVRRAARADTVRILGATALAAFCLLLVALAVKAGRDISADRAAEANQVERLRALLEERTLLIDEVNHRVKNSLQQVAAMVRLQARALDDPQAREALDRTLSRIMAVGRVHEQMYQAGGQFGVFDAGAYAQILARELVDSLGRDDVALETDVEPAELDLQQAAPLALILNELVTNALKHGCPDGRPCKITVGFRTVGEGFRLTVSDEGCGLPDDFQPAAGAGFGMRAIEALTRQLGGRFSVEPQAVGAAFAVEFPRKAA